MRIIRFVLWFSAAVAAVAQAGPYGPFGPDENYVIALDACQAIVDVEQVHPPLGTAEFSRIGEQTRLRLTMVGISHYEAQVWSGQVADSDRVHVPVQATMPTDIGIDDAICDDLNRDDVTDFVVSLWGHGNGFGAAEYDRLIVLSSGAAGYRFWVLPTRSTTVEDFVAFGTIEPIVMISHDYVRKREPRGEGRSYFVYDLWAFDGDRIVSANSIDERFPKWVRFTSKPNWRPALSVTEEERRTKSPPRIVEASAISED